MIDTMNCAAKDKSDVSTIVLQAFRPTTKVIYFKRHIINGIRLCNVTQVTSSCPWLQNQTFTEAFTYDASDQLTAAEEMQNQSYSLSVTYGNWGKISGYSLAKTDLQNNTTQSETQAYTYPATNSIGSSQTLFAPASRTIHGIQHHNSNQSLTFGINGSLRKTEVQFPVSNQNTEYYLFNSAANMKAYSNNGLDFAYYGYNAANTRSYKLSMLNQNQWVNGQPNPIHLQIQQAMFYPNAYINFNQNGEYTKHYYNGTERISSRLGNATMNIAATANARLNTRSTQLEDCFRNDIRTLVYAGDIPMDMPLEPIPATSLQQTGTPDDIFYYHTNHLGSTAFVTDQSQNITQGFLYAPFGEITTEFDANFGNGTLPKYSFNAKELDEETGMYYYEARYYKPPVFTSRDPMMDQKPWLTPYHYCSNNPVGKVDPSGMLDGDYYNWKGKYLGNDGNNDDNIYFVSDINSIKTIKSNKRNNKPTNTDDVSIDISTNKSVLNHVLDVYNRTMDNGETCEEATFITTKGVYTAQGPNINDIPYEQIANVVVSYEGDIEVSIHSHLPLRYNKEKNMVYTASALRSSSADRTTKAKYNVIVGSLGDAEHVVLDHGGEYWKVPIRGAVFYDANWNQKGSISIKNLIKILNR